MHLSSNISHWVCIAMGAFLIVVGMVSHAPRQAAGSAVSTENAETTEAVLSVGKRVVLIAIGLVAIGYGVSRVLNYVW